MSRMTGEELAAFRERRQLSRGELGDMLSAALGKKYAAEVVSRWERDVRGIPEAVSAFIRDLQVSSGLSGDLPTPEELAAARDAAGEPLGPDTPPGPGPMIVEPQPVLISAGGSVYAKACEELFEMIATGIGMVGAATGNHALVADGQIIAADRQALGAAYGRLAETNETFRKMLTGMTEGGAWLQVAMVTGTTVTRCWQSHQVIAEGMIAFPPEPDVGDLAA